MFGYSFQWQSSYNINDVIIVHTPVGRRVRSLMQVLLQSDRFWGTHHAH